MAKHREKVVEKYKTSHGEMTVSRNKVIILELVTLFTKLILPIKYI